MWPRLGCLLVLVLAVGGGWVWCDRAYGYRYPPGRLMAPQDPIQKPLREPKKWNAHGYLIRAMAEFEMTGRVLLTDRYYTGREADLSPVDLTLGWGPMSETGTLKLVHLSHLDRYYHWETDTETPSRDTVVNHSANMHILPANRAVDYEAKSVSREDVVHLQGYLVKCEASDGWSWTSSMARTDSGPGACEVIWVEKLERI